MKSWKCRSMKFQQTGKTLHMHEISRKWPTNSLCSFWGTKPFGIGTQLIIMMMHKGLLRPKMHPRTVRTTRALKSCHVTEDIQWNSCFSPKLISSSVFTETRRPSTEHVCQNFANWYHISPKSDGSANKKASRVHLKQTLNHSRLPHQKEPSRHWFQALKI